MPTDLKPNSTKIYQRQSYQSNFITKYYWDFRDKVIMSFINDKHRNILDAGCGEGLLLEKLIKKYPEKNIKGLDIIEENIKICHEHNLPASVGSLYQLADAEKYDLCILSEVIEHLENPDLALNNIKKILKPSGELLIVFPNDGAMKIAELLLFKFKNAFADWGHLRKYSPKSLKKILRDNGYEAEKTMSIPFNFWALDSHGIVLASKKDALNA